MAKVKIISNPYTREITYLLWNSVTESWEDIQTSNPKSRLREDESGRAFLPFKIKEIIEIIVTEYYAGKEPVEVVFEGTQDEYSELQSVGVAEEYTKKVSLSKSTKFLEDARFIFDETKETFNKVQGIIRNIVRDENDIVANLTKVSDALQDIIPICVVGNFSSGKSTFINALIGSEILSSGPQAVTAKIYKISRSKQPDQALIKFKIHDDLVSLSFSNEYRVLQGDTNSTLLKEIEEAIRSNASSDLYSSVRTALDKINRYEKTDLDTTELSTVIEVEVPFSKEGVLGQSFNNFVIFDTPGDNSKSNINHAEVLSEALKGFSNGIPVIVSTYETMDTNDNATLCDQVMDIKALDKRFTMIIMNKADCSELPADGFTAQNVQDILELSSIEKMYASGIYFVSSIMGLGAKNISSKSEVTLTEPQYRKIFRLQRQVYSDPEDLDYVQLYRYNIMPKQIKTKAAIYSENCTNLIYANSGLLCVEMEMENFASKYSAYNKCQMVYLFLNDVIDETNRRIADKTERLTHMREARSKEMETEKQQLITALSQAVEESETSCRREAQTFVRSYVDEQMDYSKSIDEIREITSKYHAENLEERQYSAAEQAWIDSIDSMWRHFKLNGESLFRRRNVWDSLKIIGKDFLVDYDKLHESWEDKTVSAREIDRATSDEVIKDVMKQYRENMLAGQKLLGEVIRKHWLENAETLREQLIGIIAGTEALSNSQREELSAIILNYESLKFDDDADSVFIKSRFLRGNILGLNLADTERIDLKRLTSSYNDRIHRNMKEMAVRMDNSCFNSFRAWEKSLYATIEANITEYNPTLRDMSELIKEDTEKILQLASDQRTIADALSAINELLAWKGSSESNSIGG